MKIMIFILVWVTLLIACSNKQKELDLPDSRNPIVTDNDIIRPVNIEENVVIVLDGIFNNQNSKWRTFERTKISLSDEKPVYIIQSNSELEALCPDNMDVPSINSSLKI